MRRLCPVLVLVLLAMTLQLGCTRHRISVRVVGGGDTRRGRWPWQVSLQYNGHHHCGGSLVSAQWVVSAAHCFDFSDLVSSYQVNLGEHQLSNPSPGRISSNISQIILHPNFRKEPHRADIALVQLVEAVGYTDEIHPICLPGPSDTIPEGHTCWVTGWGDTGKEVSLLPPRTLQEAPVQLIERAACNALYNIDPDPSIGRDPVQPDMVCAGDAAGQRDSCQGDSGGPLACDYNGTWLLMGVVSWGDGCGRPNRPSVYIRTVTYSEWIWGYVGSGSQANTTGNCKSGLTAPRSSFSPYMLLFTTLLTSL